ncbi:unnamed protein product [Rhodiola kirilowii]
MSKIEICSIGRLRFRIAEVEGAYLIVQNSIGSKTSSIGAAE